MIKSTFLCRTSKPNTSFDNRGEGRAFSYLDEGLFRPYTPSRDVRALFEARASELGVPNPWDAAVDVIDRIRDVLESVPVTADLFPNITNPFRTSMIPGLPTMAQNTAGLPPMPNPGLVNNAKFGNINQVSGLTLAEEVYLSPLEQAHRKKQRQQTNQTKLT